MKTPSKNDHGLNAGNVNIILAYKDGQNFIFDQLKSIVDQQHKDFHIDLFNDCPNTRFDESIVPKVGLSPEQITITNNEQNLGYCMNFLNGLKKSSDKYDYFSFCDQDDIWYSDKIMRAVAALSQYPDTVPCLYCSRTELVDASGNNHLGYSPHFKRTPNFTNALMQNIGGGNTMVMNRSARQLIIDASADVTVISHDWWAYIVVSGAGGVVIYDPEPTLKYRQHNQNLIGRNSGWGDRFRRILMLLQGHYRIWNEKHVAALNTSKDLLSDKNRHVFDLFVEAREATLLSRLYLFVQAGFHRQTLFGNIGLYVSVLLKKV